MSLLSYVLGACKRRGGGNGGGSGTFYPGVGADDGFYLSSNFLRATHDYLEIGNIGNFSSNGTYIRFSNVTVPQGATITEALLTLIGYDNWGTARTASVAIKIRAADEDDAAAPTSATDAKNRTRTTAAVDMSGITPDVENGTVWTTDDLKSVIQEVVDRGGWVSGNALLIFIDNNGTIYPNGFKVSSIEYLSGAEKAELSITWE
jgi:hypothetical protein